MSGAEHQHTGDGRFCSTCGQPKDDRTPKPKPKATVLQTLAVGSILLFGVTVLVGGGLWIIIAFTDTEPTAAATAAPVVAITPVCPTEAEQEYFDQVSSEGLAAFTLVTMFGEELQAVEETPLVVLDDFWKFARETDVMGLDARFDDLIDLEAPASVSHIDRQVEDIAHLTKEALRNIDVGIQDFDLDMLNLGASQMERVTPKLRALTHEMETFCE